MEYTIIKDRQSLQQPCENTSLEEGMIIADKLCKVLEKYGDGIGLAANQIGIQKRVCIVHIKELEPVVLINPKIIDMDDPIIFPYDGCLSFPEVAEIATQRHIWCTVETDNIGTVMFGPSRGEITNNDPQLWESVAIQHEIDHLDGITMYDREIKRVPAKAATKYGRNEKVTIKNGTKEKTLKYKKAEKFLNEGWTIV